MSQDVFTTSLSTVPMQDIKRVHGYPPDNVDDLRSIARSLKVGMLFSDHWRVQASAMLATTTLRHFSDAHEFLFCPMGDARESFLRPMVFDHNRDGLASVAASMIVQGTVHFHESPDDLARLAGGIHDLGPSYIAGPEGSFRQQFRRTFMAVLEHNRKEAIVDQGGLPLLGAGQLAWLEDRIGKDSDGPLYASDVWKLTKEREGDPVAAWVRKLVNVAHTCAASRCGVEDSPMIGLAGDYRALTGFVQDVLIVGQQSDVGDEEEREVGTVHIDAEPVDRIGWERIADLRCQKEFVAIRRKIDEHTSKPSPKLVSEIEELAGYCRWLLIDASSDSMTREKERLRRRKEAGSAAMLTIPVPVASWAAPLIAIWSGMTVGLTVVSATFVSLVGGGVAWRRYKKGMEKKVAVGSGAEISDEYRYDAITACQVAQ